MQRHSIAAAVFGRRALASVLCLVWLSGSAVAQTSAPIPLSAEQARAAGVTFAKAAGPSLAGGGMPLSGSATFSPRGIDIVSIPAAGLLQEVLVAPMQDVKAGTVIARLYSPQVLEWQRDYIQAATQEKLAADKLARDEQLHAEGIIAMSRLQESRSALIQARVAARERAQLLRLAGVDQKTLNDLAGKQTLSPVLSARARHAGTVLEVLGTPGQRLDAGAALAKVGRPGELVVELLASREQAEQIHAGDTVTVAGCATPGTVTAVGTQMQASSQSVVVRANLPQAGSCLRPNQYLSATVRPSQPIAGSVSIPTAALLMLGGRDQIFKRVANGVLPEPVRVLRHGTDVTLVQGAVKPGEEVAVSGLAALKGMSLGMGASGGR